jgi:hypothetical protein
MIDNLPKFHTLDIEYNGFGPFTAVSSDRGGLAVTLGTHTLTGAIGLYITYRLDKNTSKHYVLNYLQPGDRLKFTYDGPNADGGLTMDRIEEHDRPNPYKLRDGFRLGFEVIEGEERSRLSYPEGGGLSLSLVNGPLDHARAWTVAGNDHEEWSWQHEDLYAGDSFEIEIVETDWCDAFPKRTIISSEE